MTYRELMQRIECEGGICVELYADGCNPADPPCQFCQDGFPSDAGGE